MYRYSPEGYLVVAAGGRSDRMRAEPFGEVEIDVALLFGGDGDAD